MNWVNIKNQNSFCFVISLHATLNETLTAKSNDILPRTPQARPKYEIYTPKRDDEHPHPFHMGVPPPGIFSLAKNSDFDNLLHYSSACTLSPFLPLIQENRIGYKSTLRINAFLRLDKNLVCDHLSIVDGNCVTQTGFAKSRPAAQGTLHGPRPGGPPQSSHPAVQFRILVSGILSRIFWSVFQNGKRVSFRVSLQLLSFQSPAILVSFCCFLLKEQTLDPYCIRVYKLQLCT